MLVESGHVAETGEARAFVSGYANRLLPHLWDRAAQTRRRLGLG